MVRQTTQTQFRESDVISASEIGQYHYCSVAWYLKKCGYEPQSPLLEIGIKKHVKHGNIIDRVQVSTKKSKVIAAAGHLLFIFAALIIIFEVIL